MAGVILDAKQKAKMAEAATKYLPALINGSQVAIRLGFVLSKVGQAGTPDVIEGVAIASVVVDMPLVIPKAIKFMTNSMEAGQKLMVIMEEKGVAVPDTSGLDDAMEKMI